MTSCNLNPYTIDTDYGELVREVDEKVERLSCFDKKAARITCFDEEGIQIINKCMRKCKEEEKSK